MANREEEKKLKPNELLNAVHEKCHNQYKTDQCKWCVRNKITRNGNKKKQQNRELMEREKLEKTCCMHI